MSTSRATHDFATGGVDAALEFIKRTRSELRSLRFVRVWRDRLQIFDINQDYFELIGIGYESPDIIPLLKNINTAYNPDTIHTPTDADYKEIKTGRRHPWAEDRVM
jgi:hypothetical protein